MRTHLYHDGSILQWLSIQRHEVPTDDDGMIHGTRGWLPAVATPTAIGMTFLIVRLSLINLLHGLGDVALIYSVAQPIAKILFDLDRSRGVK